MSEGIFFSCCAQIRMKLTALQSDIGEKTERAYDHSKTPLNNLSKRLSCIKKPDL